MAIADDKGTAKAGRGGIRPDDLLTRTESVVHAELDEALVMLDPDAGRYYELDPVARRVWNLIETETPVAAVRDALTEEYAVDGRTCLRDLLEFVGKMAEHGLLRVRPGRRSGRRREASPPGAETRVRNAPRPKLAPRFGR